MCVGSVVVGVVVVVGCCCGGVRVVGGLGMGDGLGVVWWWWCVWVCVGV